MIVLPILKSFFRSHAGQSGKSRKASQQSASQPIVDQRVEQEALRKACCMDLVSSSGCMTENGTHALMSYFAKDF